MSPQHLAMLKWVAETLSQFFLAKGATKPSDRLFVDAGQSIPMDANNLLLVVVREINGGQQLFAQGFIFGMMTDDARKLCKCAKLSPASYWSVVSAACDAASSDAAAVNAGETGDAAPSAKLSVNHITVGLASVGIDASELHPEQVVETYFA